MTIEAVDRLEQIEHRVRSAGRAWVTELAVSEMTIRRDLDVLVGFDASSTIQRLPGDLRRHRELTVVTNGQETFQALQDAPGVTVLLTGGQLDRRTGSLVGPLATRAAREVLPRRRFVPAAAVDDRHGTSEATLEEAEVKLATADVAAEVVVAVDASKLGQRAPARGLPPERVDLLVTELDPDDSRLDPYRDPWRIL